MMKKASLTLVQFWVLLSCLFAVVAAVELWDTPHALGQLLGSWGLKWAMVTVGASALMGLLCLSRWVFAIIFPILALITGISLYFTVSIGVGISPGILDLAMANGPSVWLTLVGFRLFAWLLLLALAVTAIVVVRWRFVRTGHRPLVLLGAGSLLVVLLVVAGVSPRLTDGLYARLPYSIFYSAVQYGKNCMALSRQNPTYAEVEASPAATPPDVYFVIGESLRADHLSLNGYPRLTMPRLGADSAVVSFSRIHTSECLTHRAVPTIMTDNDSTCRQSRFTEQSFIPLFRKAGYATAWLANQELSDSYATFAHEADTLVFCSPALSIWLMARNLDTGILPHLDRWTAPGPRLAVIHSVGSHWWYPAHYEAGPGYFLPEVQTKDIASEPLQSVVNSYDNTILATDEFLAALISRLRSRNAVLIYVSDHGENLGEDGKYMHANLTEFTSNPACLVWFSPQYIRNFPGVYRAARRNAGREFEVDAMFHSVLHAAGISTPAATPSRSIFYEAQDSLD